MASKFHWKGMSENTNFTQKHFVQTNKTFCANILLHTKSSFANQAAEVNYYHQSVSAICPVIAYIMNTMDVGLCAVIYSLIRAVSTRQFLFFIEK